MSRLGVALHTYHQQWERFPPAYFVDETGRPAHSWRTLILPHIDQVPIYNQYNFDESWDGPNNSRLKTEPILDFICPSVVPAKSGISNYLAIVGPTTAWPGSMSASLSKDFQKGASDTILVVEVAGSTVYWSEPRDLRFDDMEFVVTRLSSKSISALHIRSDGVTTGSSGIAHVLFADGHVGTVSSDMSPDVIRWMSLARATE